MCFDGGEVGVANPDALAPGLRSGHDLHAAHGYSQGLGQEAAAGRVGFAFDGRGADGNFQEPLPDPEDLIPPGPRLDEDRDEEIRPLRVEV